MTSLRLVFVRFRSSDSQTNRRTRVFGVMPEANIYVSRHKLSYYQCSLSNATGILSIFSVQESQHHPVRWPDFSKRCRKARPSIISGISGERCKLPSGPGGKAQPANAFSCTGSSKIVSRGDDFAYFRATFPGFG